MFTRVIIVLMMGLGLTGLVGAYLLAQQQNPPAAPPVVNAPPPAHVLVASRTIRAGSLIVPEDLEATLVGEDKLQPGALRDSPESRLKLRGAMIRHSLGAGEPFLPGDFLSPGDRGFLAAVLEPGMRAVTIGVDAVSGTAGLIWPGDRIDLLLTQSVDDQTQPADHRLAGSTLLESVRVIAVDQQLVQGAQALINGQAGNRTVTLEVSPVDAERVEVAARLGRLSLAVHPATQAPVVAGLPTVSADPPQPVFGGDVSPTPPAHGTSKTTLTTVKVFLGGGGDAVEYKFAALEPRQTGLVAATSQIAPDTRARRPLPAHGADAKAKRRPLDAPATARATPPAARPTVVSMAQTGLPRLASAAPTP